MDESRALDWAHGSLCVQRLGAMLGPVQFNLPNGQAVEPLHVAPWADDQSVSEHKLSTFPGILRRLRGEWPCVPFGADEPDDLMPDWQAHAGQFSPLSAEAPPHGESSNEIWSWMETTDDQLSLSLTYPADHPISWVEREIIPDPEMSAVDMVLRIMPGRDCALPIGLHPTFTLPSMPGMVRIITPTANHIRSYPGSLESGAEIFAPDQVFSSLADAPTNVGGILDASSVPFETAGEDVVQIVGVKSGRAALENREAGYRVKLDWNAEHFPSLLLWFSNRGRQHTPWLSRHVALGMEPICSAFDLGAGMSCGDNPISASGTPTCYRFSKGHVFETRYRLSVEAIKTRPMA